MSEGDSRPPTTESDEPVPHRRGRHRRPPKGRLAILALIIATAIVAATTETPEVWAVPGVVLIAGMWIRGRPRSVRIRAAVSAAIVLTVAGVILISPLVLLVWPAAALARLVQRRGLRAARIPVAVAAAVAALAVGAAQLGLPPGIVLLGILPLVFIVRRRGSGRCRVAT